uniref:Secreted protein n=1 Tax=Panstrongylus lignarius TaxID=156445 RepID=A0A224Y4T8_9HEMI
MPISLELISITWLSLISDLSFSASWFMTEFNSLGENSPPVLRFLKERQFFHPSSLIDLKVYQIYHQQQK